MSMLFVRLGRHALLPAIATMALSTTPTFSVAATTPAATASAAAASTGTVESVRAIEVKGKGSGAGVVTGAVLGGLVGNQFGKGSGNAALTVGGAVAGGYAGNEVEKNMKKHTVYKTTIRMDDGKTRELTLSQQYALGAKVKVTGKKVQLQTAAK